MGSASTSVLFSGLMCLLLDTLTWTPANSIALPLNQGNQLDSLLGGFGGLTLEPHTDPVNVSNYVDTLSSVPDYIFDNAALIASMDSDDFHRDLYSGHRGARSQSSSVSSTGLFNSINALDDMSEYVLPKQYTPSKPSSYVDNNNHKNNYKKNLHHGVPLPPSPGNLVHIITNVVPQMKGRASSQYAQPLTSQGGGGGGGGEIDMEMIRNILSQVLKHLEDQSTVIAKGKRRSQPSSSSYSSDQQRGTPSINDLQYRPVGPSRTNQHHHHHTHSPVHSGTISPPKNFKPVSSGRRPKPYLQDMSGIVGDDGMIAIPLPPNVVRLNFLPKNKPHKRRPCKDDDEYKRKSAY